MERDELLRENEEVAKELVRIWNKDIEKRIKLIARQREIVEELYNLRQS